MELRARTRPTLRRAGVLAALTALLVPAVAGTATADAKRKKPRAPVVTSISPSDATIGDTLTIRGRHFVRGRLKNTVLFKRSGARAVFVKADIGTTKLLKVTLTDRLQEVFVKQGTSLAPTRFRVRVLAKRLSRKWSPLKRSPLLRPKPPEAPKAPDTAAAPLAPVAIAPPPAAPAPPVDCDGDGVPNASEADDDNDLLGDATESSLRLDPCNADSDGDGVGDGYEHQSARDLNDDEFQDPNQFLPYPAKRPYPNALFADADVDHDGDSLTLAEEHKLWRTFGAYRLDQPLLYSAGEQYSLSKRDAVTGRRRPTQRADAYAKHDAFLAWAARPDVGYDPVLLAETGPWHDPANQAPFRLLDFNRSGGAPDAGEALYFDFDGDGFLSDNERDEDADGLTNFDEAHGRMTPEYWNACYGIEKAYPVAYQGTDIADADTDGDGVRDGADDIDHDDIPNVMEFSRFAASGLVDWGGQQCVVSESLIIPPGPDEPEPEEPEYENSHHPNAYGRVNPFNPCLPFTWSRTCQQHPGLSGASAPFDGSPNWYSLQ